MDKLDNLGTYVSDIQFAYAHIAILIYCGNKDDATELRTLSIEYIGKFSRMFYCIRVLLVIQNFSSG